MVFLVWYSNHGYYAERSYATVDEAIAAGKAKCFEFAVHAVAPPDYLYLGIMAAWSPIGGLRRYEGVA
jgi:hypothetical protein